MVTNIHQRFDRCLVIQCVCLNPVFQRTVTVENFSINRVCRAKPDVLESSSGKGINVARVLKSLGKEAMITGFVGGETGAAITADLARERLAHEFVQTANATRICTTLLDPINNTHTEVVEEGQPVFPGDIETMFAVYEKHLSDCPLVTISGTAPHGTPADLYYRFILSAHAKNIPVLVDTQKRLLRHCLPAKPLLIKINRDELLAAFHASRLQADEIYALMRTIHADGVQWIVATHGAQKTLAFSPEGAWEIAPPAIRAVNPIGAGDASLAGIAAAMLDGKAMLDALRFGTACGTASALTLAPGCVHREDIDRLEQEVIVTRVS